MNRATLPVLLLLALAPSAHAQSLLERRPPPPPADGAAPDAAAPLRAASLFAVTPPPPRTYKKNDLIEIIINESSLQSSKQSLDAKKDVTIAAEVKKFPSIRNLLEAQLRNGDSQSPAAVDVTANNKFKGDGKYERSDRFTARITATVLEVKPNGSLVLEAQKTVKSNQEESALVLSGVCRPEDVTQSNTIQSSQLANLVLRVQNDGDVKNAARKGIIPQILETIFNF